MNLKTFFIVAASILCFATFAQAPQGYYSSANGLTGEDLKTALHNIIKDHTEFPYTSSATDVWDILKETDKDTTNSENVMLLYSGWTLNAALEYDNGNGWSREHVWAKSHGDFGTTKGAGTDAHHLRPADVSVNSARNNKDFDNGGDYYIDGNGATLCRSDADSWEARDEVKGDVARMLFYMAVRYEGENGEPDLELVDAVNTVDLNEEGKGYHGKLSTLLEWHKNDPVDSFEIRRNNVIYSFQHNRNPFIDHPEFVELIWSVITRMESTKDVGIKLYPNPSKHYVNIELLNGTKAKATIFDLDGSVIKSFEMNENYQLSTTEMKSGFYIIQLATDNHTASYKLFILN